MSPETNGSSGYCPGDIAGHAGGCTDYHRRPRSASIAALSEEQRKTTTVQQKSQENERKAYLAAEGRTAQLWQAHLAQARATYDFSLTAAFRPDGRWITLNGTRGVTLHQLTGCGAPEFLPVGQCEAVFFDPSGDLITYSSTTGLRRWPIQAVEGEVNHWKLGPSIDLNVRPGAVRYNWGAVDPSGKLAVGRWNEDEITWLDPKQPETRKTFCHFKPRSIALSPDGRWLAAGIWHGRDVAVFDVVSGRSTKILDTRASVR